jgi:hypothetical protein
MSLAAYIPFITPIHALHEWWYLLLAPLAFGIAMIYKALRLPTLRQYWRSVAIMTAQIVLAMIALAIALTILVQVVVPMLPAE